ncbi:sterol desaturase family protein [Marinomonas sp. 2405UD68-3]|uniref:sterol desaturase family protein n=1 Tax=Marinomonas sp. 2405UD68-3 TaxID=3391835 RepID=UPI0039C97458
MTDYILRVTLFLAFVLPLIAWQVLRPKKKLVHWKQRWIENLSLLAINMMLLKLIQPLLLSLIAYTSSKYGLLNLLPLPIWASILLSLLLLDLAIYWQHNLSHRIHWIWRLHRIHHSDSELDVSSAVRFHPIEIVLSLVYKSIIVVTLGIPAVAILIFDVLLNASAMFNHSNVSLPKKIERVLRLFIITPEMHRIHHSRINKETNSNYGFFLSIWDKIFNSYTDKASLGDNNINIGMPKTKKYRPNGVLSLLLMPLFKPITFQNKQNTE